MLNFSELTLKRILKNVRRLLKCCRETLTSFLSYIKAHLEGYFCLVSVNMRSPKSNVFTVQSALITKYLWNIFCTKIKLWIVITIYIRLFVVKEIICLGNTKWKPKTLLCHNWHGTHVFNKTRTLKLHPIGACQTSKLHCTKNEVFHYWFLQ